ncbi:GH25 family lysozyme [Lactobacillus gasseri]|jgi:GH25 family lysozyme M1 (1,4-beta-N-acetylmuramidase)|uniref:GH25 family lysozyme n=1 Tax=Lactobacillus gasseri TaxID=1596 RepID=UPI00206FF1EE|nr:GH25 family lysozyme [Lactobacillus gasseri]WEA89004.1 GH25 family lysozyme [Lactobacillus gasseri]DAN93471.1 MAG TPA: Cpl 1 lysin [Caudoviricetes sp.]
MLKMVDVYSGSPRNFATQAGTDITMVKATQGTYYVNPECDKDYQAAKKVGKLLGVYHYAGGGDPVAEADYFYKQTKNYIGEAVPALDWEEYQNSMFGKDLNWCRKFVDRYHKLTGVWCLIYVQQSAINQVANCANDCGLWVAWYATMDWNSWTLPNVKFSIAPWSTYTIWQFTGGDMDRNVVNTDKAGWQKSTKPNADGRPVSQPTTAETKPRPEVKKWTDDLGDVWYSEKGTFVTGGAINLRYGARTSSKIIAQLPANTEVKYDAYSRHGGYVWIRQPRSNGYGYLVCRAGNEAWGTFK